MLSAANTFGGEYFRRRKGIWKPSVSEPPSYAPNMSETAEDYPDWDGDGED